MPDEHATPAAERGDGEQHHEQRGKRQKDIDHPHEQRVDDCARIPGDEPDCHADGVGQYGRHAAEQQGGSTACEHATEHVAPFEIIPERKLAARPRTGNAERSCRAVGLKERAEHGDEHDEREQRQTDAPAPILRHEGGDVRPWHPRSAQPRGGSGVHAAPVRSLGTRNTTIRSARMLMTMYTAARMTDAA